MQTNIIWKGKLYHSIENCILKTTQSGNEINSTIIGNHHKHIYKVDYHITTNEKWETSSVTVQTQFDNSRELITLDKRDRSWWLNGSLKVEFSQINDIDISLTPFTNSLPINRLQWLKKEPQVIDVIYLDIIGRKIEPARQVYRKHSKNRYTYENFDRSFKASVQVDRDGLVKNYQKLFKMMAKIETNYTHL